MIISASGGNQNAYQSVDALGVKAGTVFCTFTEAFVRSSSGCEIGDMRRGLICQPCGWPECFARADGEVVREA
jgi:hypothetical protein